MYLVYWIAPFSMEASSFTIEEKSLNLANVLQSLLEMLSK